MEILKQRIGRYKEVYVSTEIREETMDVIVPDCNPDFESEISTFAVSRVTEKSMLSGSVRVSGDIRAKSHYDAQASESMYVINGETKFSYAFDIPGGLPDDTFGITVRVLTAETEVLNSRKVRIKTKLLAEISVFRMENLELSEDVCTQECEGINTKTDIIVQKPCVDISEKNINFTEEIRLSEDEIEKLSGMFRWDCTCKTEEVKILQNKVMVRGVARLNTYYISGDSGRCEDKEYMLPFSQVVECRNVCDTDEVEVSLSNNCCYVNLLTKDDGNTYLKCDAGTDCRLHVYRKFEGKLLMDMYSTEYDTEITGAKVYITEDYSDVCIRLSGSSRVDSGDGVSRIVDSCVNSLCSSRTDKIYTSFFVSVLYEDGLGKMKTARTVIDATADMPENAVASSLVCFADGVNVTNESAGILISVEADVHARLVDGGFYDQVDKCVMDTTKKREKRTKGNLVLRYPEKDESVWSIAKYYGTTKAAIMEANDMEDDTQLEPRKLIIIPFVR